MKSFAMNLLKAVALWAVLVIGQALGGALLMRGVAAAPAADGPLDAGQALLVVNAIDAVVLALLASCMRLRGWRLGLTLAVVLFGVETFQSQVETVIFNAAVHMPAALLFGVVAAGLLQAVLVGAAAAVLWRGPGAAALPLRGLVWKAPVIAVLYIACYLTAGVEIVMRFAAARAYYAWGPEQLDLGRIAFDGLLGLQFCRGLIWCGLVWLLARSLSRPVWRAALLAGLALSSFMDPPLLYPNPLMPWPVRVAHLWEIGVSNTVFGVVAALILLAGARQAAPAAASAAPAPQPAGA